MNAAQDAAAHKKARKAGIASFIGTTTVSYTHLTLPTTPYV